MRMIATVLIAALAASAPAEARPTPADAKAFLTALYLPYRTNTYIKDGPLEQPQRYFEAELAKRIIADSKEAEAKGDAPNLNGDPICDCQDYEPFVATIGPVRVKGNRADAEVTFTNHEKQRLQYRLIATRSGWRIYDIVSDGHSLRGMFDR